MYVLYEMKTGRMKMHFVNSVLVNQVLPTLGQGVNSLARSVHTSIGEYVALRFDVTGAFHARNPARRRAALSLWRSSKYMRMPFAYYTTLVTRG